MSSSGLDGSIFVMGNPLLDILATVPKDKLAEYGLKPSDAVLAEDKHLPLFNDLVSNYQPEYIAGGAAQNSCRVAQWMLQHPGATAYVGAVGTDKFADELVSQASNDNIYPLYMRNEQVQTGTCAVLVVDHERSMVAHLAAAETFKHEHMLSPDVTSRLDMAKVYYLSAFFLTHSFESALHVARHAAQHNKIFCMNLAAPFLLQVPIFRERVLELLQYADFVFGNEHEAAAIGEAMGWGTDLKEIGNKTQQLPKLNRKRSRVVVFTNGADPTQVHESYNKVTSYHVEPCPQNELVDVNGAGDAFVGGFLAGVARGAPMDACITAANYAAGVVIRRSGCTLPRKPEFDWSKAQVIPNPWHGRIFIMGNPLLDIIADVPASKLEQYKLKPSDAILADDSHESLFGELVSDFTPVYLAGGAAQNTARIAQWMIAKANATTYVGAVGQDHYAETIKAEAAKSGVDALYLQTPDVKTGTCAVLIVDHERSMVAHLAAAETFKFQHLTSPDVAHALNNGQVYYLSAFFLTHSFESALHVARHAAQHNKIFTMNLAAPFLLQVPIFRERVLELLQYADFVFGNEHEAAAIGEAMGWGTELKEIGNKTQQLPKVNAKRSRVVVYTNGPDPVMVHQEGGKAESHAVPVCPKAELVDVNGAGDAFVGGFLAGIARDTSIAKAVDAGNFASGVVIRRSGATYPDVLQYDWCV